MKRTIMLGIALLLALVACGQAEPTNNPATLVSAPTPTSAMSAARASSTPVVTFVAVLVDISAPTTPTTANQPLIVSPLVTPTIELRIGEHGLTIEVASTPDQRGRGLMFRTDLAENAGMLFVFPVDQNLSFWMRNTPLPLSIAFIDANQHILTIDDMQPFDEQTFHLSGAPARYALEVHQGWFAAHGINTGDRVEFTLPANLDIR